MHIRDVSAILLILVILSIGGYHGVRYLTRPAPHRHTVEDERYAGVQLANQALAMTAKGDAVAVIWLFRRDVAPYQARADALRATLEPERILHEIWAVDEGLNSEEDYVGGIDHALKAQPASRLVLIVGPGSVTHTSISNAMHAYANAGGKFLLMGEAMKGTRLLDWGKSGKAVFLARRTGWLRPPGEPVQPTSSEEHFNTNYVLLDENFLDWP